ncbi:hypothetical protein K402DRAFT_396178 [Aulographum hederae CBS 113979]|uniref:Uncharacterized protein n=1 Tax=Aulographum hederae CBS 113979 TaxID=1176131 RepID=A0A6G1GSS9_9PEZI|nr:hypothetical protein K402DRAFT_396178 [Aulographum hederae CBS 113979]
MSDEASTSAAEAPNKNMGLNDREVQFVAAVFRSLKSAPEIDYPKVAELMGMSNPRSASNSWAAIKKKMFPDGLGATSSATSTPRKTATPRKTKKRAATPDDDGDSGEKDAETMKTPAKKARKARGKAAAKKEEEVKEEMEVEDGEGGPVKEEEDMEEGEQMEV